MHFSNNSHWAEAWFEAWNSHDLERILGHYAAEVQMVSPMIQRVIGEPSGRLHGKAALQAYWDKALALVPDLHFEPIVACWGVGSVVLNYRGVGGRSVSEFMAFDDTGLVHLAHAHYAP